MTTALSMTMESRPFTIDEFEGEGAFHSLRAEWDALWAESMDATHFQLWDWQYLYWKHVTPRAVPRFMTLRDPSGRCSAIATVLRTRDPATGFMTTGFVGEMRSDYNMVLAGKNVPESQGLALLRALIRRHRNRSSALSLTNIPLDSWTGRVIRRYQASEGVADALVHFTDGEGHSVSLPISIDEYVAGLAQRARRHYGYERRRLEKECKTEFRVHEGVEGIDVVIDQIESIDRARWGMESMYRRPERRAFERSVIRSLAERGLLRVFLLSINGKVATFAWCALVRGAVEIARIAYDPSFPAKLSVGKVANFLAIEECIRRGYREFDLGCGGEAYKSWLGARPKPLLGLQVHRSSPDRVMQKWGARLVLSARKREWLMRAYRLYQNRQARLS